jgi:Domain of unknown function (DUF2383)
MNEEFIGEFNTYLAGEISAVETYELALKNIDKADIVNALVLCHKSHATRVEKLKACVLEMGGVPGLGTGVWGSFAKLCQESTGSETAAIAALEQSEAERLVQYEAQQKIVVSPVIQILQNDLLPAQHETHLTMSTLLKSLLPSPA